MQSDKIVLCILKGLPEECRTLITIIKGKPDLLAIEELLSKLLLEEQ